MRSFANTARQGHASCPIARRGLLQSHQSLSPYASERSGGRSCPALWRASGMPWIEGPDARCVATRRLAYLTAAFILATNGRSRRRHGRHRQQTSRDSVLSVVDRALSLAPPECGRPVAWPSACDGNWKQDYGGFYTSTQVETRTKPRSGRPLTAPVPDPYQVHADRRRAPERRTVNDCTDSAGGWDIAANRY
jgi:hypothetical protein